jgi:DNA polymerase-3 subunit alpha
MFYTILINKTFFEQMYQVFKEGFVDKNGIKHLPFCDDIFTEDVFNEAISNTRKIAISTEDIKLDSTLRLPKIYEDGAHILREKINKGFKNKELDKKPNYKDYIERIAMEYNTIVKLGWADYFLVMEKIVSDTVEEFGEWAIGYGRGSCGSSLVAYCLGLTDIDPIRYGLLFERFISADRGNITSCTFEL